MTIKRNPGNNKIPESKPTSSDAPVRTVYRNIQYMGLSVGLIILLTAGFFIQSSNDRLANISSKLIEANLLNEQLLAELSLHKQQFNQLKNKIAEAQKEESEVARQIQNLALDFNQVQDDQTSIRLQLDERNTQIKSQSKQLIKLQKKIQQLTNFYLFGIDTLGPNSPNSESLRVQKTNLDVIFLEDRNLSRYQSIRQEAIIGSFSDIDQTAILADTKVLKRYLLEQEKQNGASSDAQGSVDDIKTAVSPDKPENDTCEVNILSNGWIHISALTHELSKCTNRVMTDLSPHLLLIQLNTSNDIDLNTWKSTFPDATIQIKVQDIDNEESDEFSSAFLIPGM